MSHRVPQLGDTWFVGFQSLENLGLIVIDQKLQGIALTVRSISASPGMVACDTFNALSPEDGVNPSLHLSAASCMQSGWTADLADNLSRKALLMLRFSIPSPPPVALDVAGGNITSPPARRLRARTHRIARSPAAPPIITAGRWSPDAAAQRLAAAALARSDAAAAPVAQAVMVDPNLAGVAVLGVVPKPRFTCDKSGPRAVPGDLSFNMYLDDIPVPPAPVHVPPHPPPPPPQPIAPQPTFQPFAQPPAPQPFVHLPVQVPPHPPPPPPQPNVPFIPPCIAPPPIAPFGPSYVLPPLAAAHRTRGTTGAWVRSLVAEAVTLTRHLALSHPWPRRGRRHLGTHERSTFALVPSDQCYIPLPHPSAISFRPY